jgi:hypothetical protein
VKPNRIVLCIFLLTHAIASYAIGFWMIDFHNLPHTEKYQSLIDFAVKNERLIDSFIPDEYWTASLSKHEIAEKLVELYNRLNAEINDPPNQDLCLLKGLVCHYLFNLDVSEYHQLAIDNYNSVSSIPGHDYRFIWMLGIHYTKSVKPFEAIEQFSYVAERIPEGRLHPGFCNDYGYAAALAFMPVRAIKYFELSAKYGNDNLDHNSLYQNLKKNLVVPDRDVTIDKKNLYKPYEREESLGLLSRPLGIWIPLKESWKIRMDGYSNERSSIFITPDEIKSKEGQEIGYTIALFFRSTDENIEHKWMESYKDYRLTDDLGIDPKYKVYEYADPYTYPQMGGSHGYVVFVQSNCPALPGENIEAPSKLYWPEKQVDDPSADSGSGSGSYVPFRTEYSRFRGQLNYVFLLDACNAIFEVSKDVFRRFLQGVIIE